MLGNFVSNEISLELKLELEDEVLISLFKFSIEMFLYLSEKDLSTNLSKNTIFAAMLSG